MATTMKLIAKQTLSSDTTTVTFSSIPGTFTDLLVICSARHSNTDGYTSAQFLRLNGSTSSYTTRNLQYNETTGPRSAVNAYNVTSAVYLGEGPGNSLTADTFGCTEIYLPNYAGSTNKSLSATCVGEHNGSASYTFYVGVSAGLWSNTAAVTEVSLHAGAVGTFNFKSGSSFYLYGITKA